MKEIQVTNHRVLRHLYRAIQTPYSARTTLNQSPEKAELWPPFSPTNFRSRPQNHDLSTRRQFAHWSPLLVQPSSRVDSSFFKKTEISCSDGWGVFPHIRIYPLSAHTSFWPRSLQFTVSAARFYRVVLSVSTTLAAFRKVLIINGCCLQKVLRLNLRNQAEQVQGDTIGIHLNP